MYIVGTVNSNIMYQFTAGTLALLAPRSVTKLEEPRQVRFTM